MPRLPDMFALFGGMPAWIGQILVCITVAYVVCVFGVAFGKMGRSPWWGLIFTLPFLGTIMLWTFGLRAWPTRGGDKDLESGL
jgi:hypothetical protein